MIITTKISGVFEQFPNLDKVTFESVKRWLNFKVEDHTLENFIANRLLYPQTVPMNEQEMEIDLSILRETLKMDNRLLYNPFKSSIIIPEEFEVRFPPLIKLISALCDVLVLKEVTKIYVKSWVGTHPMGSIVIPKSIHPTSLITLGGKKYQVKPNSLNQISVPERQQMLQIDSFNAGVSGGEFGVFIDLRPHLSIPSHK